METHQGISVLATAGGNSSIVSLQRNTQYQYRLDRCDLGLK